MGIPGTVERRAVLTGGDDVGTGGRFDAPEPAGRNAPLVRPGSRGSTDVIHVHLRRRILSGEILAGAELSQAQIAKDFGVSRGPVREAFRLLQRERLIEAAVNQRARVAQLSLEEVEQTYALRVVNESLALAVSVPRFDEAELAEMDALVTAVGAANPRDFDAWEQQHQRFHGLLLAHAGAALQRSLSQWAEHTERYRRVYVADERGGWALGSAEHALLARACRARDPAAATGLLARHLARAALTLVSTIDPAHEPALLRAAIRQVTGAAAGKVG